MKIMFVVLMFLMMGVSLEAYEKQIVLDKFNNRASAELALKKFKNDESYAEFESLANDNDLKILMCSADDSYILVVEPIGNKYILQAVMDIVKLKFEDSYSEYLTPCKVALNSVEVVSKPVEVAPKPVQVVAKPVKIIAKPVDSIENISSKREYLAKIIFSTFSTKENARRELKSLQHHEIYKELDALAVKNYFTIQVRSLGKYKALLVEPIVSPKVYQEVMTLIKRVYKDAYGIDDSMVAKQISKKSVIQNSHTSVPKPVIKKVKQEIKAKKPKQEIKVETPKQEIAVETPKQEIVAETPKQEIAVETPKQEIAAETPKQEIAVETPKQEIAVETPKQEIVAETPKQEIAAETPNQEIAAETPNQEIVAETPNQEIVAETPKQEIAVETPNQEIVVETPKQEITNIQAKSAEEANTSLNIQMEEVEMFLSTYFSWWYLFFTILVIALLVLYKKFKAVYDKY